MAYGRQPAAYYHRAIVHGFLSSQTLSCDEDVAAAIFKSDEGVEFRSLPDTNELQLWIKGRREATYDLEHFYTDESDHPLHKHFLVYVRRRFGVTLRVNYR